MSHLYRLHSFARLEPLQPGATCFAQDCSTEYKGSVFLHDRVDRWFIGRGKPGSLCDVPISDEKVATSSLHAVIYCVKRQNGNLKVYLKSLTETSTTWVNGSSVAQGEVVELDKSAEIWLGYIGGQTSAAMRYLNLLLTRPFVGDHVFEVTLGSGAFGEVHKVHRRLAPHRKLAVKVLDFGRRDGISEWNAKSEISIVKDLLRHNHDHIVPLFSIYGAEDDSQMYIYSMEFLPHGDLRHVLEKREQYASLDETFIIMSQMLSALSFLHGMGILHRDIKLLNILVKSTCPWWTYLADFGTAKRISLTQCRGYEATKSIVGTRHYVAPEVTLNPEGHGPPADLYSLGVVLFTLLQGNLELPPYRYVQMPTTFREHVAFRSLAWDRLDHRDLEGTPAGQKALKLVRGLLETNPRDRISIVESLRLLRDIPVIEPHDLRGNKTQPGMSPSLQRVCACLDDATTDLVPPCDNNSKPLRASRPDGRQPVLLLKAGSPRHDLTSPPAQPLRASQAKKPQPKPRHVNPKFRVPAPPVTMPSGTIPLDGHGQVAEVPRDAAPSPDSAASVRRSPRLSKIKRAV